MAPRTRYVDNAGCTIAYQVIGGGPVDLVFIPGLVSHLDMQWADPLFSHSLERLASFCRLIIFDQRGVGLSDAVGSIPTLDERVGDTRAVMAAAGSEKAFLLGHCNGGPVAVLVASLFPESTRGLVLCSTFAKGRPDAQHPGALPAECYDAARDAMDHWGEGRSLELFSPSRTRSGVYRRVYASFERAALSRGMARASLESTLEMDVTDVLANVVTPTLVLHCTDDFMSLDAGRYMADSIAGAEFVELPGADHVPFSGNSCDELIDHIERFMRSAVQAPVARRNDNYGIVMFTDIVGSTDLLSQWGDTEWRRILGKHDAMVRDRVDELDGVCIKFTGDGYLTCFTSPEAALRCAHRIAGDARGLGLEVRVGIHAGPYLSIGEDLSGITVHAASRILDLAGPSEILVSSEVRKLVVGSGFRFSPRGSRTLRGIAKPQDVYAVDTDPLEGSRPALWTDDGRGWAAAVRVGDRALALASVIAPRFTRAVMRLAGG